MLADRHPQEPMRAAPEVRDDRYPGGRHSPAGVRRAAFGVLLVLLVADAVFLYLHRLWLQQILSDRFSLANEASAGELYQNGKELALAAIGIALAMTRSDRLYTCWAVLFIYLFLDDTFEIHERMGDVIGHRLADGPVFGLYPEHFGELVFAGLIGTLFLTALAAAWLTGTRAARRFSLLLVGAVAALAAFGVVADTLQVLVDRRSPWHYRLGIVDDGGELVMITVMLWIALRHLRPGVSGLPRAGSEG